MTTDKPTTDETGCKNCDAGVPVQLGQHFLKPPGHSMYSETCTATKPTTEEAGLREVETWLRAQAEDQAKFMTEMQHRRSAEYQARGDKDAYYKGIKKEETTQWRLAEIVAAALRRLSQRKADGAQKLWLWKNFVDGRREYWAFDNPYPCYSPNGDPMVLGEPCGYALLKPSHLSANHQDWDEQKVLAAINRAAPPPPDSARERALEEAAQMADEQADFWREQKKQLRPESDVPDAHERFSNYIENATAISRSIRALRSPAPQGEVRNR